MFEHTELFQRGVGDTTDVVQKEMYTFNDKGGRSITLKPEGTAGVARAFIEDHLFAEPLPCKMYYVSCPAFRYEKPQSGRLRQFHQNGVEVFGAKDASVDAEIIALALDVSAAPTALKTSSCAHQFHRLPHLPPGLSGSAEGISAAQAGRAVQNLSASASSRNPLRILDCKEDARKAHRRARACWTICATNAPATSRS